MFDVITVGSATQDVYLFSRQFKAAKKAKNKVLAGFAWGAKIEVDKVLREVGGGATNAAATFVRQGWQAACLVKVGDDPSGEYVLAALRKMKINTQLVVKDYDDQTALSVFFLNPEGERAILVYRGASADFQERMVVWRRLRAKWYYISSLGGNLNFLSRLVKHARQQKAKIAINPGQRELKQTRRILPILRQADVVLVNQEEAGLLFRTSGAGILKTLKKWQSGIFVVTNGQKGSSAFSGGKIWHATIRPVKAVDTTGAGDAFGSGFVAGLMAKPGDLAYALKLGSSNAAAEVKQIGAKNGLLSKHSPLYAGVIIRKV